MSVYYNEIEPFCVEWLKNLMAAGHIPAGDVDERPIQEVSPDDVKSYGQCHFFAGIGGWAYALRLAGWPADRDVWTGSCPCQPFSVAGKGDGEDDPRHLWPHFYRLIRESRPGTLFGEQVSGAIQHGWLDLVQGDLEREGYSFGAVVLGAHSVGAPHKRDRLYFVGEDATRLGCRGRDDGDTSWDGRPLQTTGLCGAGVTQGDATERGPSLGASGTLLGGQACGAAQRSSNPWDNCAWIACTDGRQRPIEPGTFPLAHGIPGRVGRLRAYGNAIVPQVAAASIEAYLATE